MPLKILLVDDHPLFRDGMRAVLNQLREPVDVILAENCETAMRQATTTADLDLVLLDINLSGSSGLRCLPVLKSSFPLLPVVILSANEDGDLMKRAFHEGAQGYIPKSSTTEVMLNAIYLVLSGGIYVPEQTLYSSNSGLHATSPQLMSQKINSLLTPRQIDVLRLLSKGLANKEIAHELKMSEGTVRIHVSAIFRGLDVNNRTQASMLALQCGLVDTAAD